MSLAIRSALLVAAVALAARREAAAQMLDAPTCTERGITRFALSVPPDRTRDEMVAALSRGEILPGGSEAYLFPDGVGPRLLNGEQIGDEARRTINRIIASLKVDGQMSVLLTIDVDGKVTAVTPNSGSPRLDSAMRGLWRKAEFAPVVVGGCRVETYFHIAVGFVSDYSLGRREMRMRIGPYASPAPRP